MALRNWLYHCKGVVKYLDLFISRWIPSALQSPYSWEGGVWEQSWCRGLRGDWSCWQLAGVTVITWSQSSGWGELFGRVSIFMSRAIPPQDNSHPDPNPYLNPIRGQKSSCKWSGGCIDRSPFWQMLYWSLLSKLASMLSSFNPFRRDMIQSENQPILHLGVFHGWVLGTATND